jgi:hypothetical protein
MEGNIASGKKFQLFFARLKRKMQRMSGRDGLVHGSVMWHEQGGARLMHKSQLMRGPPWPICLITSYGDVIEPKKKVINVRDPS